MTYKQQTKDAVEGAGIFPLIGSDKYILMYDVYMKGKYQFTESADLEHFKVIDHAVSMDFHPRHSFLSRRWFRWKEIWTPLIYKFNEFQAGSLHFQINTFILSSFFELLR